MRLILWLLIVGVVQVHGGTRTQNVMTPEVHEARITVSLKEGFHYNEKAPNTLVVSGQSVKPEKLEARKIEFGGLPKDWKNAEARVYICDDAVTFCETQTVALAHPAHKGSANEKAKPQDGEAKAAENSTDASPGRINTHGFIENDFLRAVEAAKAEKKMILVDFSARWCPGCVRLESDIFPTGAFQGMTKNFVKVKIDTDRFENLIIGEKFKIEGIPALVVINAEQEEIHRILGYQSLPILEKFFASIKSEPETLVKLIERAKKKNPRVLLNLGRRLAAAGRYQESLRYLSQIKPVPKELLSVKVEAAGAGHEKSKAALKKYLETLRAAIEAEPESVRSIAWRTELVSLTSDPEEKVDMRKDGVSIADDFLKDREGLLEALLPDEVSEYAGFESFMIATQRAELIEASGAAKAEITAGWKKAAQVARDLKIPSEQTGPSMRRLSALLQAGLYDEAEKLSAAMLKADPQNPELKRRRLKALLEKKSYSEVIELGAEVLTQSYGRNEFMVVETLVKAYLGAGQSKEAGDLLDRYLSRHDLNWGNMKAWREKLEELKRKLPNT